MAMSLVYEPPEPPLLPFATGVAQLQHAKAIHQLIDSFTHDGTLLPRSYAEICANIRTFIVVENEANQFIGCAALHVYGPHLAEIRSIVVRPDTARTRRRPTRACG